MKRFASLILVMLVTVSLTSCYLPGYKLKPGDKIGEMVLTGSISRNVNEVCRGFDTLIAGTCEIPASVSPLGISTGWAEATLEDLDLAWKDSTWKMSFDGREIDLTAFDTFDLDIFPGQKARVWSIGIINPTPGRHTIQYDFYLENSVERGNHSVTWSFTIVP
jgi:hypothetical protein